MFLPAAEDRFQQGLHRLASGRARDALPFISEAIRIHHESEGDGYSQATYLSYHGLCLCLTRSEMYRGVRDCREATQMDPCNAAIWWNLGRVALMVGRRAEAQRAFHKGLHVQPGHAGIVRDLDRMGRRRPPVLGFLSRSHPSNRLLGRLRHLFSPSKPELQPPAVRARVSARASRSGVASTRGEAWGSRLAS